MGGDCKGISHVVLGDFGLLRDERDGVQKFGRGRVNESNFLQFLGLLRWGVVDKLHDLLLLSGDSLYLLIHKVFDGLPVGNLRLL